jgi:YidC/Oxa1 family membrane protein insertase
MLNRTGPFEVNLQTFAGPKDVKILEGFDPEMAMVVDFGWFSAIARQILNLLRLFFDWFGNWGVAIIALTILVRVVLLPLHIMSYKSMEGMKKIQPVTRHSFLLGKE